MSLRIPERTIKTSTWNVKTMFQEGKIHNTIQKMTRLGIDIMGVSEMRWSRTGLCSVGNYNVYYSGNQEDHHIHGVGDIVSFNLQQCVTKINTNL